MEHVECIIVGAGVIGLAIGRQLAKKGIETVVIEQQKNIGTGISSRNSEVIHAGIYYPEHTLKAKLCVEGKHKLYKYCLEYSVPVQRIGKLILATNFEQKAQLGHLKQQAERNGVSDTLIISKSDINELEPDVEAVGALFSPSTGIVDTHQLMLSILGDFNDYGGNLALNTALLGGRLTSSGCQLRLKDSSEYEVSSKYVINCAGLNAIELAHRFENINRDNIPKQYFAKGSYFSCHTKHTFKHLLYPIPEQAGLGIHLTLDMAGNAKFGPDVEWINKVDYSVDPKKAEYFYNSIKNYWPTIPSGCLVPDYAGIRPKIVPLGKTQSDFHIKIDGHSSAPALINLFGFESPGLTSCLAIADYVSNLINSDRMV